jgi:mercuric ion transport protein
MDKAPRQNVDVLYFEGCPNHQRTVELARDVVAELGVDAAVEELEVKTLEDAVRLRFLGSPSVQVDGVDIDPAARASTAYAFACRTYDGAGVPPRRLLVEALGRAPASTGDQAGARGDGWRRSLPTVAGAVALLLPVGTCPACFPAYAAVLSALGLPFLLDRRYVLPIAAVLLATALSSLAYRARSRRGFGPFLVGVVGSVVAVIGKFALTSDPFLYVGLSVLVAAATWNAWPQKDASPPSCATCAPREAEAGRT